MLDVFFLVLFWWGGKSLDTGSLLEPEVEDFSFLGGHFGFIGEGHIFELDGTDVDSGGIFLDLLGSL